MTKQTDGDVLRLFWEAPEEALFNRHQVAVVLNRSYVALSNDAWKQKGVVFKKILGKPLYKKRDVLEFIEKGESATCSHQVQ